MSLANRRIEIVNLDDLNDPVSVTQRGSTYTLAVEVVDDSGNQITNFAAGAEYTEGDTDPSIKGTAMMWEDAGDTLRAISASKPLPVDLTSDSLAGNLDVNLAADGVGLAQESGGNLATLAGAVSGSEMQVDVVSMPTTTVDATDLDIRDLSESQDAVTIYGSDDGGTTKRIIKTDAGGAIQVDLEVAEVTISDIDTGGSQTNDLLVSLDGESVAVTNSGLTELGNAINASNQMDVNIAADGLGGLEVIQDTAADLNVTEANSGDILTSVQLIDNPVATISSTDVMRVALYDDSDGQITSFAGTEFSEDAAHSTGDKGIQVLGVRNDTLASLVDTDGDYSPLQVNASGALYVDVTDSEPLDVSAATVDVNIASDGSGGVEVIQDTAADFNVTEANSGDILTALQILDDWDNGDTADVTIAGDSSGGVEVVQGTHDDLNANANLQVGDADVDSSNPVPTEHSITGIGDGVKTVATAGTDEALAGSTACKRVVIQALLGNTGNIAVGASGVDATATTGTGIILEAGDVFELEIDNLADIYIDSTQNGEGVRYTYFT